MPPSPAADRAPAALSQRIAQTSLLIGLLPLLPVPLLDDILRRQLARGLYVEIAVQHGHSKDEQAVRPLAEDRGSLLLGCLVGLTWGIIKKLFKTVLYVLTIKELGDWAGEAAVRAALVERAFAAGALPAHPGRVRDLMDAAWKQAGRSPVIALLQGKAKGWEGGGAPPEVRLSAALAAAAGGPAVTAHFDAALAAAGLGRPALPGPGAS